MYSFHDSHTFFVSHSKPLSFFTLNSHSLTMDDFSASNHHTIAKGKRTKRTNSSSLASSPPTTEEDQDLANCLILLARGPISEDQRAQSQLTHRKLAKIGIYVYECKTCSRSFSSFQALGGHRASHKKPKPAADFDSKEEEEEEEEDEEVQFAKIKTIPPPPSTHDVESKARIHECSICGSEFASGQALGGHMRRHRSAAKSSDDDSPSHEHHRHHAVVEKPRNILTLDLNLPAPPEVDRREAEFRQRRLVFTAAALVDCHY